MDSPMKSPANESRPSLPAAERSGRVSDPDAQDRALLAPGAAAPAPRIPVHDETPKASLVSFLQQFSVPLIAGVIAALAWANLDPGHYKSFTHWVPSFLHDSRVFHHGLFNFLVNDIFMVFFFGVAAKEITEATLPGGHLNPPRKAMNPLLGTLGGVVGPVAVFFGLVALAQGAGAFETLPNPDAVHRGWGIPTATDIALAWLVARTVFGAGHPAVGYLLLLAVADDAIGLGIIAVFYGDPKHPTEPLFLGLILLAMVIAFGLRQARVKSWLPYVFIAGPLSWAGLSLAHLHPALALVFVIPFLPGPRRDTGLFAGDDEVDLMGAQTASDLGLAHSPLHNFSEHVKLPVDFGLFFFGIANAGVEFSGIGAMTWIVLGALVLGKTCGIALLGLFARKVGFPLPGHMSLRELCMAGFIASLGLTVALFVAGAAFPAEPDLQGQAKMGALFTGFVGLAAIGVGRLLRIRRIH